MINYAEIETINTIFNNNGWINKKSSKNEYVYIKTNEYDEFRIELEDNLINITRFIYICERLLGTCKN